MIRFFAYVLPVLYGSILILSLVDTTETLNISSAALLSLGLTSGYAATFSGTRIGTCRRGWKGPNCTECQTFPSCLHGTCNKPWECICEPGWAGLYCNRHLMFCDVHPNVCQHGGVCIGKSGDADGYRCVCHSEYTGRQCEIKIEKPESEQTSPSSMEKPIVSVLLERNKETTVSRPEDYEEEEIRTTFGPFGPIVLTDFRSAVESEATTGEWTTELITEVPVTDSGVDEA